MDSTLLVGHEDVRKAGHQMQAAAERMARTEAHFEEALTRHERFLDEWLARFVEAIQDLGGDPEAYLRRIEERVGPGLMYESEVRQALEEGDSA